MCVILCRATDHSYIYIKNSEHSAKQGINETNTRPVSVERGFIREIITEMEIVETGCPKRVAGRRI